MEGKKQPSLPASVAAALAMAPMLIVVVLVLVAGLAGFFYLDHAAKQPHPKDPPLTGAAWEYVHHGFLPITDFKMEAHESYLKQQVVEITGKIGNTGDRVIDTVEIVCVFYDPDGQMVMRRRVAIVKPGGRLAPGDSKPFRLPFDDLPASWNQAMPQMVIARIEFS
jgi:hypothetical protein